MTRSMAGSQELRGADDSWRSAAAKLTSRCCI